MLADSGQKLLTCSRRMGAEPQAHWAPKGGLAPPAGAPAQVLPDMGARAAGHRDNALAGPQEELPCAAAGGSVPGAPYHRLRCSANLNWMPKRRQTDPPGPACPRSP